MKAYRLIKCWLLVCLSMVLIACSLFNSGEKIDQLQGTIQALTTQVGNLPGDKPARPAEPDVTTVGGADVVETALPPQNEDGLELVDQYGGSAAAVAVRGNYAYLGQGPRLVVLDISNPQTPVFVTQSDLMPGIVLGVEVDEKNVYVTSRYGGLYIYDTLQPGSLELAGSVLPQNPGCGSLEIVGSIAYIACNPGGLFIVDVGNPSTPKILSTGIVKGSFISIAVFGDYAYLADLTHNEGVLIADVSDPANPRQVGYYDKQDFPGDQDVYVESLDICGDNLCLAVLNYGLAVLDLENPEKPVFAGGDSPYTPSGIVVDGDYAYLDDMEGVSVYDISNPASPSRVGNIPIIMDTFEFSVNEMPERGMYISGNYLYITDQRYGLRIMDITRPNNPRLVGQYMTPVPDVLFDIEVVDSYAFLISRSGGFRVLDVADPLNMEEIYYDDFRKNGYTQSPISLDVIDDFALITDSNYPFHVYDVSNPRSPKQISAIYDEAASDGAHDMVIAGSYAYLSGWGLKDAFYPGIGLWVIDISKPENPVPINFVDLPNDHWSLGVKGTTLYALDGVLDPKEAEAFSLRILDISDGAKPVVVKSIPIPELQNLSPSDLTIAGNDLYLSTGMMGLKRYDITDPLNPIDLPLDLTLFPYVYQLHAELPYLVVNGNQVWDISQPNTPVFIGYAAEALEGWACDIKDDLLYLATKTHGVYVYRIK